MTLPRVKVLSSYWAVFPPAHLQLARITGALGFANTASKAKGSIDPLQQAITAGIPVMQQRPDDPLLDLCGF